MLPAPELDRLLSYQNALVIQQFRKNHPEHAPDAEALFTEMLKYLWLSAQHQYEQHHSPNDPQLDFSPVIHEEMQAIDSMWHEFILVTMDYQHFCQEYFGRFVHHIPNTDDEIPTEEEYARELTLFLEYVLKHLGEETLERWFRADEGF